MHKYKHKCSVSVKNKCLSSLYHLSVVRSDIQDHYCYYYYFYHNRSRYGARIVGTWPLHFNSTNRKKYGKLPSLSSVISFFFHSKYIMTYACIHTFASHSHHLSSKGTYFFLFIDGMEKLNDDNDNES